MSFNWLRPPIGGRAPPQEILRPVRSGYIALTLLTALVFNLLALPEMLTQIKPDLIALTLIYWVVYHPRRVGFLPAWFLGLTMDVADGSLFGQHALAYAVLMYLAILLHRRILMFGMRQQIVHVAAILCCRSSSCSACACWPARIFRGRSFLFPALSVRRCGRCCSM